MMNLFLSFLFNVFCGMFSAIAFLFFVLYLLRPKILISEFICKQQNQFENDPKYIFVFKIINNSNFSAFDIQLELFRLEEYRVTPKGRNIRIKLIPLVVSNIKHIPPYIRTKVCNKTSSAPHAVMFRTIENLENILNIESQTLQLQITLRHGLTGLSRVYQKDYININNIKSGQFKFGNNLEVE